MTVPYVLIRSRPNSIFVYVFEFKTLNSWLMGLIRLKFTTVVIVPIISMVFPEASVNLWLAWIIFLLRPSFYTDPKSITEQPTPESKTA